MNPFSLAGPDFLVVYGLLSLSAVALAALVRRAREPVSARPVALSDPYEIAYLRGGADEAVRIATFSLLERGLIDRTERGLRALGAAGDRVHAVERAIVDALSQERPRSAVFAPEILAACRPLRDVLCARGLVQSRDAERRVRAVTRAILAILVGAAGIQLAIALAEGRSNVWLLLLMCAAAWWAVRWVSRPGRTRLGNASLAHLERRIAEPARGERGEAPGTDAVHLAAVLGLAALPSSLYPWVCDLFPGHAGRFGGVGSSSDSGGDGGGGDGGGCGGCGGCGS
jgi:uncharacterized protein (TIGR04222 family)